MKKKDGSDMSTNDKCKDEISLEPRKVKVTSQDEKFLKEFQNILEKNLSDPDFDIDALCAKLYISRATLFRKVKALTKETPNEFIQSYRLKRAAQLLRENFGNVTEVAEAVGFSDQFYFSKCFKNRFCRPPKQYQLEQLKKNKGESQIEKKVDDVRDNKPPQTKLPTEPTISVLDRELVTRGAQMMAAQQLLFKDRKGTYQRNEIFKKVMELYDLNSALNEALNHFDTGELTQKIRQMIAEVQKDRNRNEFYSDERLELFEISIAPVRKNALSVAAVCMKFDLLSESSGYFKLKVKTYGPTFNLCESELFYNQPAATGPMCTGVLVDEDVIVTAAHFANEKNVTDLRFVFDYVMQNPIRPVGQIPADNIYSGVEILQRIHHPERDMMLVKLDRKVTGREIARLSKRNIFLKQPVYVIGHPCGLPLKCAPGASIDDFTDSYFRADLDVYSGNSGSPVFCAETHELIGIVSRAKSADFRWTGNCWITMRYPKDGKEYKGAQCTRALEFGKYITK